ncbi:MAG: YbaB/EbfC family nucleoid-associated protein [Propionibacteriaceae bacterium]|nr:YbaB/EbfC family nucleoid-associated protein [Propionibacteriaceae bacterium]
MSNTFPEGFNMADMMAQAKTLQAQMQQAQMNLQNATFTGTAGGGLVTATLKGTGELVGLQIDPSAIDPSDPDGLADLIVAASRAAYQQVVAQAQASMPALPDLSALGL